MTCVALAFLVSLFLKVLHFGLFFPLYFSWLAQIFNIIFAHICTTPISFYLLSFPVVFSALFQLAQTLNITHIGTAFIFFTFRTFSAFSETHRRIRLRFGVRAREPHSHATAVRTRLSPVASACTSAPLSYYFV